MYITIYTYTQTSNMYKHVRMLVINMYLTWNPPNTTRQQPRLRRNPTRDHRN